MSDSDHDKLNRVLDHRVSGPTGTNLPEDDDSGFTETIRYVERLAAKAGSPEPDRSFVYRLRNELMQTPQPLPVASWREPVQARALLASDRRGWSSRHQASSAQRKQPAFWAITEIAAALLLMLTVGYTVFTARQPPADSQVSAPVGLGQAGSDSAAATPERGTCTVEPSSLDRLNLTGEPSSGTLVSWRPTSGERPAIAGWPALLPEEVPTDLGQPADKAIVALIEDRTAAFIECVNAGDAGQIVAFLSDDYIRRVNAYGLTDVPLLNPEYPRTFAPLGSIGQGEAEKIAVSEVRLLADGRVAAILTPTTTDDASVHLSTILIFTQNGDRWLIDEALPVAEFPHIEIVIRDDGFSPSEIEHDLADSKNVVLVVRNQGTQPHSIVIPALGARAEVAPGETVEVTVGLHDGTFDIYSDLPGDQDAGLTGTFRVQGGTAMPAGTPAATPATETAIIAPGLPLASVTITANPPESYDPPSTTILADRDVEVTIVNASADSPANFTIDDLGLSIDLAPGETRVITIHSPAGIYSYHSTLPGHTAVGMVGTLFVVSNAAAATPAA